MSQSTKALWEKTTIIKDSVHGYINVPKPISSAIIDTEVFQRLKNIEQTGMQVLYPSATHNRFTHSLGVYHLSKKAFHHFKMNVKTDYEDIYTRVVTRYHGNSVKGADAVWSRWELMFQLACLLHDCGHSPFSHTLEFVYDLIDMPKQLSETLKDQCSDDFKRDFDNQSDKDNNKFVGKPHERMSALLISLKDSNTYSQKGFREKIGNLIESYLEAYDIINIYSQNKDILDDDVEFMVRMIIGCRYDVEEYENYIPAKFHDSMDDWLIELQLRNCIIGMLNSKLDVDNLDYVVRDSKYSGYASNNIDLERLLSSFTIINAYEFDENNPLEIEKEDYFDASINLAKFEGDYIKAKVSGKCIISSKEKNISVTGNIFTDDQKPSHSEKKMIFRTKEEFSANVDLDGFPLSIEPKHTDGKAYLNISGHLKGKFTGIVLGDTCRDCKNISKGRKRIFFAYKQNCMSVLMSAIDGSNFENQWIYAHHTTTFKNNFLVVYLLERYAEYYVDQETKCYLEELKEFFEKTDFGYPVAETPIIEEQFDRIHNFAEDMITFEMLDGGIRENILNGEISGEAADIVYTILNIAYILEFNLKERRTINIDVVDEILGKIQEILKSYFEKQTLCDSNSMKKLQRIEKKYEGIAAQEIQYFAKIMTMLQPNEFQGKLFYMADDQVLLSEYKQLYYKLIQESPEIRKRYQEFMISFKQYASRESMKCMWKTYPEYNFYFSDWTPEEIDDFKHLLHRTSTPWGRNTGEKQMNYSILSDNVTLSTLAADFWAKLKAEFHITRLVYVEQDIRVKSFVKYETYIKNHDRVVRLEDIKLYPNRGSNADFFYIYYETEQESEELDVFSFLQTVRSYIKKDSVSTDTDNEESDFLVTDKNGNTIIRDNVYGDIVLKPLFTRLIDTKEFQRLRRVKQLAAAEQVFPGAVHTRFAHSIGTFHIMGKLLAHFKEYLKKINYEIVIDEMEEDAILAAALLHDLGHGPYSHAFENAGIGIDNRKHSDWTIKIILDESTDVNKVLNNVSKGFADKVADYIRDEDKIKNGNSEEKEKKRYGDGLNFRFIFASLVSGQIDADRMDYLLRDAKFTGVTYGQFDYEKVIEGLAITVDEEGRYRVCILEDYLPAVEEYFYARFQMHDNIYCHPHKMFSEKLFQSILKEAQNMVLKGEFTQNAVPPVLNYIFERADLQLEQYCQLDDSVIDGAIQTWSRLDIPILSFLCESKLERRGYIRLDISDVELFEEQAKHLLGKEMYERYILIRVDKHVKMYDENKPVYILMKNGVVYHLKEYSALAGEHSSDTYLYYSRRMAEEVYKIDKDKIIKFEQLLEKSHPVNNMEIEKKYTFPKQHFDTVKRQVEEYLMNMGYSVEMEDGVMQEDCYYDTFDQKLRKLDYTLRFRKRKDKTYITCKCPGPTSSHSNGIYGQLERREIEKEVTSDDIRVNGEEIEKLLREIEGHANIIKDLTPNVKIENERTKILIKKVNDYCVEFSEFYEMVLDDVKYINLRNNNEYSECQLEIELKSSYQNRLNMKKLTDEMESQIKYLVPIEESKYQRALRQTGDGGGQKK